MTTKDVKGIRTIGRTRGASQAELGVYPSIREREAIEWMSLGMR